MASRATTGRSNRTPEEARMPLLTSQNGAAHEARTRCAFATYAEEGTSRMAQYLFMTFTMIVPSWRRCTLSESGGPEVIVDCRMPNC